MSFTNGGSYNTEADRERWAHDAATSARITALASENAQLRAALNLAAAEMLVLQDAVQSLHKLLNPNEKPDLLFQALTEQFKKIAAEKSPAVEHAENDKTGTFRVEGE